MNKYEDITVTSLDEIRAYGLDGDYKFTLDELQDATISNTEDKVDITGRAGRKLSTIKRNKAVTVSGTNGMLSTGLMGVQTGNEVIEANSENPLFVDFVEAILVDDSTHKATLKYEPYGGKVKVYKLDKNEVITGNAFTEAESTPSAGEYKYAEVTNSGNTTYTLTFNEADFADTNAMKIAVFYNREITVGRKVINTDTISTGKYELYIDGTAENKCGDVFHIQFHIPKADFSGNFDIALGGDQVVHAFEADALAGGCGSSSSEFWDYIIFGETA